MKRKKEKEFVKVCPNCGSTDVLPDLSKDMIAWGGYTRMQCRNCNFSSIVFPEITKNQLKKYKEKIKQRTPEEKKEIKEISKEMSRTKGFTNKSFNKLYLSIYVIVYLVGGGILFSEAFFGTDSAIPMGIYGATGLILFLFIVVKGIWKK